MNYNKRLLEIDFLKYHPEYLPFIGDRYNEFKIRLAARNSVILIYKNQTVLQVILHFIPLTAGFLIKQLFFAIKGYGKTYHKAVLEGLKLCSTPEMKQKKIGIVKGHFADACIAINLKFL